MKGLFSSLDLELFKPAYTDDESEEHDDSENESVSDGDTSHSSQEEDEG